MFDLNPFAFSGVDVRDVQFAQFFLVWLLCRGRQEFPKYAQVQAVQNFKNAAHYDLKTVKIVMPDGTVCPVVDAALCVLREMQEFYQGFRKKCAVFWSLRQRSLPIRKNGMLTGCERSLAAGLSRRGWRLRSRGRRKRQWYCKREIVKKV